MKVILGNETISLSECGGKAYYIGNARNYWQQIRKELSEDDYTLRGWGATPSQRCVYRSPTLHGLILKILAAGGEVQKFTAAKEMFEFLAKEERC